ncbi:unnamed protein product [Angiostrongylus costaricensis]|uniref:Ion_trans_2 domain-containing protein n=1 Tax=Angiostrongylus costaricensis TaxID=334426 RepID=A0A0R3PDL1_ANGCS|nr:unnamed protein product [Angiostrongylus costaricensis]
MKNSMRLNRERRRKEFFEQPKSQTSGEQLWSNLLQQKIPDSQKLAFQQLTREILESRKTLHKLWKYVVLFLVIGLLSAVVVYFLTCWVEYLEVIETKYIIRAEIFASDAPVCLGVPVRKLGEPPSRLIETCARLVTIISIVMLAKGIRLGWKIWHMRRSTVNTEELENDPIKVLSETLQKDFLSHIADSGLAF